MSKPEYNLDQKAIQRLRDHLATKPKVLIIAHRGPDGDTLGSALGLASAWRKQKIDVTVACADKPDAKYNFLPGVDKIVNDFDEKDFQTYVFVDAGHPKMAYFGESKPYIFSDKVMKINIDHHPSNSGFGDLNFVHTRSASTTEIVFLLLQELQMHISPEVASCLLLGIYTDTGALQHQNTTPHTYHVASKLVALGASNHDLSDNIFRSYPLSTMHLWGRVLDSLHITPEGAAIVGVKEDDYASLGASRQDLEGLIDLINSLTDVKYSVMLSEDNKGNVKGSLRTRQPDVDLKSLAEKFGGGGHVKASGFFIPGSRLEKEVKWKIAPSSEV